MDFTLKLHIFGTTVIIFKEGVFRGRSNTCVETQALFSRLSKWAGIAESLLATSMYQPNPGMNREKSSLLGLAI